MPRTKISEFSSTPANNTDIDSINIAEGCAPSGINDAIRELMAQLKDWQSGTSNDPMVIGSSGSLTLNQGTANGVTYLNGSKVVTSGSALTFDGTSLGIGTASPSGRLHVANTGTAGTTADNLAVYFSSTNRNSNVYILAKNTDGSTLNFGDGDSSTVGRISYDHASNYMAFDANGSEQMRLTSTGLGIGTSSPSFKLDLNGIGAVRAGNAIRYYRTDNAIYTELYDAGSSGFTLNNANGNGFRFQSAGSTQATLDSSGNLGLGVTPSAWTSPDFRGLQVGSGIAVYGRGSGDADRGGLAANCYNDGSWKYIATGNATRAEQSDGTHAFFTAASGTAGNAVTFTQAMTLDASGNLGVGTTSPAARLDVSGGSIRVNEDGVGTKILTLRSDYAGVGPAINVTTSDPLLFLTANTERARIDSSGNFAVGQTPTTSINSTAGTTIASSGYVQIQRSAANPFTLARFGSSAGTISEFYYNTTSVGSISITASATAYNTSSDYRLKDNPQTLTGSGEFIDALKPKTWNWKVDGSKGVGFLAHEAQAVSPSSVSGQKDATDEEGKPIMQAMEYGSAEFIANIIAELQSLRQRVAQLEAQ